MISVQLSHSLPLEKNPDEEYFNKNRLHGNWYLSEKYDGIRAVWTGSKLITRAKREFAWVPKWFLDKLPKGFPLDGELIIHGASFGDFSSISIQKECDDALQKWNMINYMVFDTPLDNTPFFMRLELLKEKIKLIGDNQIKLIEFTNVQDISKSFQSVLNPMFDKVIKQGGEGIMLVNQTSMYSFGKRSRMSLKYKKVHEGEAKVIDFKEGTGKYTGVLGKIKCRLPNGNEFLCGTGFNDLQRNNYKFKDQQLQTVGNLKGCPHLGDTITYSCMEIIQKTGIPRMSVFKGIRADF